MRTKPFERLFAIGMAGIGIVEAKHLKRLMTHGDGGVDIVEKLDTCGAQRASDLARPRPMVVVAEHGESRRLDPPELLDERVEIELAMTDEISRKHHDIGLTLVGQIDRFSLDVHRRHAPKMLIGQVRNPNRIHHLRVANRPSETADRKIPFVGQASGPTLDRFREPIELLIARTA